MALDPDQVLVRDGGVGDVDRMPWATGDDQREAWRAQARRAESGEVCFLVAEVDGEVVAKAVVDWARGSDGSAWLWMFSVRPDLRSRGIGSVLLREGEERARQRGCPAVDMAVDDDNPRARELYLRRGYAVAGTYVDEYRQLGPDGTPVDVRAPGVVLRKEL
ncbi:MAG: GNAT family N-acetyltransferase [Candidatus Nanopelagicales bacterium]